MMKHFSTTDTKFFQARNSVLTSQQTSSQDLVHFQWEQASNLKSIQIVFRIYRDVRCKLEKFQTLYYFCFCFRWPWRQWFFIFFYCTLYLLKSVTMFQTLYHWTHGICISPYVILAQFFWNLSFLLLFCGEEIL